MKVLVVEDDTKIAGFLQRGFEADGHTVDMARTGEDGLRRSLDRGYDLIILDIGLPGMDGLEVLRRLRAEGDATPVIVVTARGEVEDRVRGLDSGADDYITKPFSFVELQARVRALQRRSQGELATVLRSGDLLLDTLKHRVTRGGQALDLTPREFQLLEYFMRHPEETVTRAMLADRVWGMNFDPGSNVIDVYVNYLRKKIGGATSPIRTIRGVGYIFQGSPPAP